MFYGDIHFIDILIFGGIAAFLFYRLRSSLGKRTGYEKKHNRDANLKPISESPNQGKAKEVPELEPNIKKLETAYEKIDNFNHVSFLEGAKSAFETIVNLFNEGNKEKLKSLLTKDTYLVFCKTIDLEKEKNNNQMLSVKIESVENVEIVKKKIFITILYSSTQINLTTEKRTIKKDKWTFEKNIDSKDPSWLLSST